MTSTTRAIRMMNEAKAATVALREALREFTEARNKLAEQNAKANIALAKIEAFFDVS